MCKTESFTDDNNDQVKKGIGVGSNDIIAPEDNAWLPSRLVFHWATPVFRKASIAHKADKGLDHDDLLPLIYEDTSSSIYTRFNIGLAKWRVKSGEGKVGNIETGNKDQKQNANIAENSVPDAPNINKSKPTSTSQTSFAMKSVLGRPFWFAGVLKGMNTMAQFSYPFLLNDILKFVEEAQGVIVSG